MLAPETELRALVRELEETGPEDPSHLPVAKVRELVARAMRCTHQILHPGCNLSPANDTLRFALLDLDNGSPRTPILI